MPNPNPTNSPSRPASTNPTPGTPGRDQGEREGQRNRDQGGSQRNAEGGNVDEREQNQRPGDEDQMERDNRGGSTPSRNPGQNVSGGGEE